MFETSLVESSGRLRSRSGRYLWLTASVNLAALAVMMLIPLLYPEALPHAALTALVSAPPPPPPAAAPRPAVVHAVPHTAAAPLNPFTAPATVPRHINTSPDDPPPSIAGAGRMDDGATMGLGIAGPIGAMGPGTPPPAVLVKPAPPHANLPLHVSSGVVAGNRLAGVNPVYPAIARAAHVSGAVILHAVISRTGSVEQLSVVSGNEMLRTSAVAAVQNWRYKPYLLNGEPTAVDTTITVNFAFNP